MVEYRDRDPLMPNIHPGHEPARETRLETPVASGGAMRWLWGILAAVVLLVLLMWAFGGGDSSVAPTVELPAEAPATAPAATDPAAIDAAPAPEPAPAN